MKTSSPPASGPANRFGSLSGHKAHRLAFGLWLLALVPGAHAGESAPSYSIKEETTGSLILQKTIRNISVPPEKSYAELTPEEKQRIKSLYEPMPEEDEPPYPLHGLQSILKAVSKAQGHLAVRGTLRLAVSVSATGEATRVEVYESPDDHMTQAIGRVLLQTKYKPALCHGVPCRMQYPFSFDFRTE